LEDQLAEQTRLTIQGLIVLQVHCRDVAMKLIENNIAAVNDFDWIGQLRYYLDDEILITRMINASLSYGYEYLGNTKRLVVTPLTERCYRTIYGALHFNLGCSIEVNIFNKYYENGPKS
jgi:dynein heavy chain